jgi:hypothetical protein
MSTSLRELKAYDGLIARAGSVRNPRIVSLLLHHRKEFERSLRGVDPQALQDMEVTRAESLAELHKERDALRTEEMAILETKKKKKEQAKIEKEAAAVAKVEKHKLREAYMKVDRYGWEKTDFGSSAKKLERVHRTNIQDFVTRIAFPESNYQLVLVCDGPVRGGRS